MEKMKHRGPGMFIYLLIIMFSGIGNTIASEDITSNDAGWQELGVNHFDQAETHFLKSIGQDDQDPRPYLALSYIMQLKEEPLMNYY